MIRYGREERRTVSHSYGNRCHVFLAYTDGECEIPDTLCVKKGGSMARGDTRALWHAKAPRGTIVHK